ncbi:hypothetical protein [Rhizorhabdus sp. FW153]|uniref:hypothetical protein n=1 Tax=Rhizorhabdus sp. FW153 TaxID=3400216 RepID=UPI003CEB6466
MRRTTIQNPVVGSTRAACAGRAVPVEAPAIRQALSATGRAIFALLLLWLGHATARATESLPLAIVAMAFAFLIAVALWSAVAGVGARR